MGTSFSTFTFFSSGLFIGVDVALPVGLTGEVVGCEVNDGLLLPPLVEPLPATRADFPRSRLRDGAVGAVAGDEALAAVGVTGNEPRPRPVQEGSALNFYNKLQQCNIMGFNTIIRSAP